jgi:surface protein
VVDMYYMFAGCSSLKKLDVRSFTTGSVTDMSYMFNGCSSLKTLDLSNFDASRAEDMWYMFYGCTSLTTINAPRNIACENAYVVTSEDSYVWCEPDGTIVTKLPQNASESVKLTRKTRLTKENTTIVLSKTAFTYSGKAKKPTVTVYNAKGKEISSDYYDVTYKDNKEVGKATLTVTFTDKYIGTIHKTYKINPQGTELKKVTSEKTKKITVTWKKATQITGYEIQYATDKKFTKKTTQTRTVTVKSKKLTATIGKLSAKKTYYVRIRTYTTIDGKNYCSAWSKALSVTTK